MGKDTKDAPVGAERPDAKVIQQETEDREQWIKDHEYTGGGQMTPEEYSRVGRENAVGAKRAAKTETPKPSGSTTDR